MKLNYPFFGILLLLFVSCQQATESKSTENSAGPMAFNRQKQKPESDSRKLIRTGTIRFETDRIRQTHADIVKLVRENGGYISSDESFANESEQGTTLEIRVPEDRFDAVLKDLVPESGEVDYRRIHVEDVTEEYLDVEARLKTKKALEMRYLSLLDKANSVKDILEIEKQGGELRTEIESIEGRLRYLQNQVSFARWKSLFTRRMPAAPTFL